MTLLKTIFAQFLGIVSALFLQKYLGTAYTELKFFLLFQSLSAVVFSIFFRQAWWWIPLHLLFLPCALGLLSVDIAPGWYLLMTLLLLLLFWGTFKGDVPLFLSSNQVTDAMLNILKREQAQHFCDLGAGIGSLTLPLARALPGCKISAYERAPLPWLLHKWRARHIGNLQLYRSNFWQCPFAEYDVIFAFLSPAVMPEIGKKLGRTMRPGTLLVSSSFPVPHWEAEFIENLHDSRQTQLYGYRIGVLCF